MPPFVGSAVPDIQSCKREAGIQRDVVNCKILRWPPVSSGWAQGAQAAVGEWPGELLLLKWDVQNRRQEVAVCTTV